MTNPVSDPSDRLLMRELQRDARQTNRALADAAGLAPSTTLKRVRDLEHDGVITGYHAVLDSAALGRNLHALVFVRLQPKSDDVVNAFVEHVWALPATVGLHLISGTEDVVIHLAVPDAEALRQIVLSEISSYPGVFDERTSLSFEHRHKWVVDPADH
ncbi:MAG: Lrp/AsnC family transcriptional regulator [Actinomycetota bacterium]